MHSILAVKYVCCCCYCLYEHQCINALVYFVICICTLTVVYLVNHGLPSYLLHTYNMYFAFTINWIHQFFKIIYRSEGNGKWGWICILSVLCSWCIYSFVNIILSLKCMPNKPNIIEHIKKEKNWKNNSFLCIHKHLGWANFYLRVYFSF